jgi:hypothetical protein
MISPWRPRKRRSRSILNERAMKSCRVSIGIHCIYGSLSQDRHRLGVGKGVKALPDGAEDFPVARLGLENELENWIVCNRYPLLLPR